ncbi:para-aminobenzoate synthase [Panus rudis PR-1116 ss-1]|nr:para-aminobenzoate synthase [Panus rudis PR-1116 ss-1]
MTAPPRVLLVDSYDSFTHNLASLFRRAIPGCEIHIIHNDQLSADQVDAVVDFFDAIVVGPGPGSPNIPEDAGILPYLWKLSDDRLIPIFGVCLGLQSLGVEYGGTLRRLNVVKHGQISPILHEGRDLFKDVAEIYAVRYHSLHVLLQEGSEHLESLAWSDDGHENGRVVMAIKHKTKPFWAVQYHPESVRTTGGLEVVRNFWRLANKWSADHHRVTRPWTADVESLVGAPWPSLRHAQHTEAQETAHAKVTTQSCALGGITVTSICELLGVADERGDFVLLDSVAQPGRFAIIGCLDSSNTKITYTIGESQVYLVQHHEHTSHELGDLDIWSWLASFMRSRRANGGKEELPFWGGLVGYLSYELGVHTTLAHSPKGVKYRGSDGHPDVNMIFVDRSIVVDFASGEIYVQSLRDSDEQWISSMLQRLQNLSTPSFEPPASALPDDAYIKAHSVSLPDRDTYISQIKRAKEYLYSGDSYELCLTAPSHISTYTNIHPSQSSSWHLYKILRHRNPAPHAAYLRLQSSTLVSSSPERFLSYSRPPGSICQLRPIKGTVRKKAGITRAVAEELLVGSPKEVAENLMIVDLIRHDLHGVVGDNVDVKEFCTVEEYETVWQLVSVIEGRAAEPHDHHEIGWDVLRRSLPPGSMTGAPKQRSVEILDTLEPEPRRVYSGVHGYWCVGGGGDWAVTIRTCFKYCAQSCKPDSASSSSDSEPKSRLDRWTLGAGGAITALSDPEAEWDEMITKVESVLQAFNGPA